MAPGSFQRNFTIAHQDDTKMKWPVIFKRRVVAAAFI
jgi:hypothetical protein